MKTTKVCVRCMRTLPIERFVKKVRTRTAKHSGETYTSTSYDSHCSACDNKRFQDRREG